MYLLASVSTPFTQTSRHSVAKWVTFIGAFCIPAKRPALLITIRLLGSRCRPPSNRRSGSAQARSEDCISQEGREAEGVEMWMCGGM